MANIALHGLATAVENAFPHWKYSQRPDGRQFRWKPSVIRYADDFVILHRDLEVLIKRQEIAAEWLKGMGLEMKPSKTRITHTLKDVDGTRWIRFPRVQRPSVSQRYAPLFAFDRTGVRWASQFRSGRAQKSQKRFLLKVREIIRSNRNASQVGLIAVLNPVIRGWGNYFSTVVSKNVFRKMDSLHLQETLDLGVTPTPEQRPALGSP